MRPPNHSSQRSSPRYQMPGLSLFVKLFDWINGSLASPVMVVLLSVETTSPLKCGILTWSPAPSG
jgi:hypothetical protein